MNEKKVLLVSVLVVALIFGVTAIAWASNGDPSTTVPSSGNTSTGTAVNNPGNPTVGQAIFSADCAACHGAAGQPVLPFPGLCDVENPNPAVSIDPQLYDPNPAFFARNIDPFIQHGSTPAGSPAPMPSWGDSGLLTQDQIADVEAYIMSLSKVNWPVLSQKGAALSGSKFVPGSLIQLYLNGAPYQAPLHADAGGNISASYTAQPGKTLTANYALLNLPGIYPNGDATQGDLGMDGSKGAALTVATLGSKTKIVPAIK